jgi:hypothetical protein
VGTIFGHNVIDSLSDYAVRKSSYVFEWLIEGEWIGQWMRVPFYSGSPYDYDPQGVWDDGNWWGTFEPGYYLVSASFTFYPTVDSDNFWASLQVHSSFGNGSFFLDTINNSYMVAWQFQLQGSVIIRLPSVPEILDIQFKAGPIIPGGVVDIISIDEEDQTYLTIKRLGGTQSI